MEPSRIEFTSGGERVRGRFFPAEGRAPATTLLLVPGWPGNTEDVLGLGSRLSGRGFNVCFFNPRGLHDSEGFSTFANTLDDIAAALDWLEQDDARSRFRVDPAAVALGGHSFGGGMAMAHAARDPRVRRVVSIAGTDHGELVRSLQRGGEEIRQEVESLRHTRAPEGPARFDPDAELRELADNIDIYGLRENAGRLADRSILLIGGWEDRQVTVDGFLLPLYRALRSAGAQDVTFLTFHDDHGFGSVRDGLAEGIAGWLSRPAPA